MLAALQSVKENRNDPVIVFIYENYRNDMFRAVKSIVQEQHLAEDIVQETFERIIKKIHLINNVKRVSLRSYTILIAKSIAYNMLVKLSKTQTSNFEDIDPVHISDGLSVEEITVQKDTIDNIQSALNQIGINYAAPMILRYYYGFSDKETAEILSINSSGTVRSLCSRGKRLILDSIAKAGTLNE